MPAHEFHYHWISDLGSEGAHGMAEARFPYWSFTKTVIAICALKLAEQRVVDLDAPIAGERHTLRQLLAHTAGLPDYYQLPAYARAVAAGDEPWPRETLLAAVLAKGPLFGPGEGWSYSNVGMMLAREEIEAASGEGFASLVDTLVCGPLGLTGITLATEPADFSELHWEAARTYHPGWVYHGCLTGTAGDAARVLSALFAGRLIGAEMLEQMLARRALGGALEGRPWTDCGYGLGLMSGAMGDAGRAIGHSGGGPFSVNAVYHFPDRAAPLTVAVFTDGTAEGAAEFRAAGIALGDR